MTSKILTYADVFNIKGSFNLYPCEDINLEETKKEILNNFERLYLIPLKVGLKTLGLKFNSLNYYSPKYYNHEGDSLDLSLRVTNKKKFREYVILHAEEINKNLDSNKSYDGYTALTISDIEMELTALGLPGYEPDILVLKTLLNKLVNFKDFDPSAYFVYEETEEEKNQAEEELREQNQNYYKDVCGGIKWT